MKNPAKRSWLIWLVLPSAVICGVFLVTSKRAASAPPPLVVLQRPFSPPVRLRDQVECRIPATRSWGWAHHLVDAVFGKRKPVNLDAESFAFHGAFSSRAIEVELGPPAFSTRDHELSVWFLGYGDITGLRARLESAALGNSYRCRVNTADGVGASVFVGSTVVVQTQTNQIGIHHDYYPMVRPNGTDLFVSVEVSALVTNLPPRFEPTQPIVFVETNVDLAVRIQIPARQGVFLVKREPLAQGGRSAGLVLDPLGL